ncbi:hypothetical protein [Cupriavidus sp. D384]|uniref:hypothetical protein n=1 Tax=Cupriavidus sp. D384 TaxID=1538095 RepID=UPI00082ABA0C|nr:hypothetical protein [Cupriavidus sp. D384]
MKGFWNNASVAGTVGALVTWMLGKAESAKLEWSWNWIPNWVVDFGTWLRTPLIDPVQLVWIFMGLLVLRAVYLRSRYAILESDQQEPKEGTPRLAEFTQGTFGEVFWRWDPSKGMSSLTPYCQWCDFELDERRVSYAAAPTSEVTGHIECPHCSRKAGIRMEAAVDRRMTLAKKIDHAIRNGAWKGMVLANRERTGRIRAEATQ